ncbi:MAG: phosphate signaling complex protein PhoU [Cyanobacteria bacterium P01_H01_bin.15]
MFATQHQEGRSAQPTSIRRQFQRSLRGIERNILRMGALVEESFRYSHRSFFAQDLAAVEQVAQLEKRIDQYYRSIEIECATLMALQAPVAQDLRCLNAFMQLIRDLERIGDYAQDLSEMSVRLFNYSPHPNLGEVETMSLQAQLMLSTSLVALADLDAELGLTVKSLDDTVDDAYDQLYHTLAFQKDIPGVIEPILLITLSIRHLERMADHATNIGQRVAYIVTGERK